MTYNTITIVSGSLGAAFLVAGIPGDLITVIIIGFVLMIASVTAHAFLGLKSGLSVKTAATGSIQWMATEIQISYLAYYAALLEIGSSTPKELAKHSIAILLIFSVLAITQFQLWVDRLTPSDDID